LLILLDVSVPLLIFNQFQDLNLGVVGPFHMSDQARTKKMVVAPEFGKRHTASELRDVDEMEGSVQRVQTVEHESKEEWRGLTVPPKPPIVKVLLKRMERAGHNGPLAQIFSIKIQ
jgi:hypothetical protein